MLRKSSDYENLHLSYTSDLVFKFLVAITLYSINQGFKMLGEKGTEEVLIKIYSKQSTKFNAGIIAVPLVSKGKVVSKNERKGLCMW